jgi:ribose transport system permease protein
MIGNPNILFLIAGIVIVVIISFIVPNFMTWENITSLISQASTTGLMAIGLTFVIITAGIDLSLPCVMALSSIVGCMIMRNTQNVLAGVLSIIAVAAAIGAFNGLSVSRLKMVPMIVTLAVQTVAAGLSSWITGATSVGGLPKSFSKIFAGSIFGFPISALIFILIAVCMHLLLSKTIFGRQLYQVGVNEKTAKVNGVNTERIIFMIYLISGIMAGVAGVLNAAKLNCAGPSMGTPDKFTDIVCGVVIGGGSVMGGKGTILGTVLGSLFMAVITNVMNLYGVDYFITFIIKGGVIVLFTYFDILRNKAGEKR